MMYASTQPQQAPLTPTRYVLKQVQRRAGLLFGLALLIPVISLVSSMVLELVPGSQTNALLDVEHVLAGTR